MKLDTKHFGTIEIDGKGIIDFSEGLPGFEQVREFVLLGSEDSESMFMWLQSVDEPTLAFVVVNPFLVKKDYEFDLDDEVLRKLDIKGEEDILIYSIVVVPEDLSKISMNLKAPVVINNAVNKGMQVVLDTDKYSVRHYIMDEAQRWEVAVNACSDKEEGPICCDK